MSAVSSSSRGYHLRVWHLYRSASKRWTESFKALHVRHNDGHYISWNRSREPLINWGHFRTVTALFCQHCQSTHSVFVQQYSSAIASLFWSLRQILAEQSFCDARLVSCTCNSPAWSDHARLCILDRRSSNHPEATRLTSCPANAAASSAIDYSSPKGHSQAEAQGHWSTRQDAVGGSNGSPDCCLRFLRAFQPVVHTPGVCT